MARTWLKAAVAAAFAIVATCGSLYAAPVTYSFTTDTVAFGGPSAPGILFPSPSLFTGGTSGTFVYDSEALLATTSGGTSIYRGFTPSSVTGFATSLSSLSGSVGSFFTYSDVSGSTQVGNDTFGSPPPVDIVQLLFDPGPTSTAPRNFSSSFAMAGLTLIGVRMFWIEGQAVPDLIPDFLSNQNLLAAPPSFPGRIAFDFIETGNPAATSFIFFDNLRVVSVAAAPEPGVLALLALGLAGLGLALTTALRQPPRPAR